MYLQLADWIVPLMFLLALVLLLKFRPALILISRESYYCVSGGVATLALVSVARVYYLNGLFAYVPFLSEPLFYRVVSWIGIITGTVLVANGMSTWLPIARLWRLTAKTEARYSVFVQKIERLTQVESRADRLISLALTVMFEHFRLSRGVALRYSRRDNKFDFNGCIPETFCVPESFAHTTLNYQVWRQSLSGAPATAGRALEGLPDTLQSADLTVPLALGDQPLGCYLLWSDDGQGFGDEDVKHLRLAADIIARKVDADRLRMRADYYHRLALLNEKIQECVSPDRPLLKNLGAVLTAVNQTLNVDFVSLQVFGTGPRPVTCLSVGANGALLIEKGLAMPPTGSPVLRALTTGQPVIQREPERRRLAEPDDSRSAMPSLAAVPLPTETESSFVFVVSSRSRDSVGRQTARMLQSLGPVVTRLVEMSKASSGRSRADQTLATLCDLYLAARRDRDVSVVCAKAAAFLKRSLRADIVRISAVEPDSPFLKSLAFAGTDQLTTETPHDKLMIRSLMPLHDSVAKTGRLVLFPMENTSDSLTAAEKSQGLCADVNTLVIAPVTNAGRTDALITVGRVSEPSSRRFTRSEVLLVRATADCLGAVTSICARETSQISERIRLDSHGALFPDLELRSRMKSSLSGIMGSVELMKAQGEPDAPSLNRYLSIIDKSTL